MPPLNILIVGCSIAGPTLATFLLLSPLPASEKPHITILERSPALRVDGQNIDVRGTGVTIIRKLGLEAAVRASTTGEEGVQFVDRDNRIWAAFPADKSGKVSTPTSDIEILRGRLSELLWRRSKLVSEEVQREGGMGIEYIFGDYLDELEQDGEKVHVHFAKGKERRTFDLVVGADGLQSRTRNMVWGAEGERERVKRLGMYGAFFSMPSAKTDSMWRRWFHAPGRRGIMVRPDEQREKTTVFMYVINEKDIRLPAVAEKGREDVKAQKELLKEYFQDAGWESERIIREMIATKDFYYDTVGQVRMDKWSKGRVVLLGDAGYCASPLSGMGTTLALNGAYNLAGALERCLNDHTAAFAEYENKMRPLVDRAQKLAPGMPHMLNPETAWGVWVLNAIMYFFSWSGLISLMFKLGAGPPANAVPVEDYEFKELPEMRV
ncbi:oxidoreductase [Gymnopus androsaceus JB14]|uniref:Oxidoreductase n=1 Tax=Gymnopus androsaceus JB14 TaxID=1447944 RepID=A0A6A4I1Z2_9AGAR|nr:oxidoreductase [Gymnopus androsaceus JB14]